MAFKTFAPGVLTSSDVNTFLMRQAVITCTSSTRPASPSEGMTIYETDTDFYLVYDGSNWRNIASPNSWISFTPTVSGTGAALGNGTITSRYMRVGRTVFYRGEIIWGSTSTQPTASPNTIQISWPISPSSTDTDNMAGIVAWLDTSVGQNYAGVAVVNSGAARLFLHRDSPTTNLIDWLSFSTDLMTPVLANGDELRWHITYEAA